MSVGECSLVSKVHRRLVRRKVVKGFVGIEEVLLGLNEPCAKAGYQHERRQQGIETRTELWPVRRRLLVGEGLAHRATMVLALCIIVVDYCRGLLM